MGLIIEAVSGVSYEDYISQNIFKPLGMDHSAASLVKSKANGLIAGYRNYFGLPIAGEPDYPPKTEKGSWTNIPAGYLSASVSDMEKYLQMYLNGGENIVGSNSINEMFYNNVPAGDGVYYGMGWNYSEEMFSKPMLWHAGLVENYTSNMFIIPDKEIAVVVLVNMNDYLVCNNLIGNVIMPLLGEEKQELPNLYLIFHFLIDMICLAIFIISAYSVFTLKKWKVKTENKKIYASDILRHIVIPVILLLLPPIMGVPYRVIWLFVKDISIVLFVNAVILITVGIYKIISIGNGFYHMQVNTYKYGRT